MAKIKILSGAAHTVPADLKKAISANSKVLAAWNDLTPLMRNEWICWTVSVKKQETRQNHIDRVCSELITGKRRPCCWAGCPHR